MTTIQAVFFGLMAGLVPSILFAFLLWRDEIGLGEDKKPDLRNRYASPDLEFDDQPSYPNTQ
jgi:hypothetical protein